MSLPTPGSLVLWPLALIGLIVATLGFMIKSSIRRASGGIASWMRRA